MALVKGTNCGFVTVAPVANPSGFSSSTIDGVRRALKDTSPVSVNKVTEIGWWCDNATDAADFDIAIYTHNSGDNNPEAIVGIKSTAAKGTTAGWKKITGLNIPITAETIYWIAVQVDVTTGSTNLDYTPTVGEKHDGVGWVVTELPDPWGASSFSEAWLIAVYAIVEYVEPPATNMKVNISDVFKDISEIKVNIGDAWKNVIKIQQNIGDVWKDVFG